MANIKIPQHLLEKLEILSQHEQRPVEEVLISILERVPLHKEELPPVSLSNLDDLPRDEEGMNGVEFAALPFRQKLYKLARRYWRQTGNTARLSLTDQDLDEQFWFLDEEVPRLKSDEGTFELLPNPLEKLIGLFAEAQIIETSTNARETLDQYYREKYDDSD